MGVMTSTSMRFCFIVLSLIINGELFVFALLQAEIDAYRLVVSENGFKCPTAVCPDTPVCNINGVFCDETHITAL